MIVRLEPAAEPHPNPVYSDVSSSADLCTGVSVNVSQVALFCSEVHGQRKLTDCDVLHGIELRSIYT